MKEERKEAFGNLSNAFETDYEEVDKLDETLKTFEAKKNKLVEKLSTPSDLEDLEYMRFELKSLVEGGLNILQKLDEDIKIGSKVRSHEVYFSGVNSIRDTLKELRELNRTVVEIKLEEKRIAKGATPTNLQINNFLDSRQLLEMVNDAKKNSSLNEIKAEFIVTDSDQPPTNN